MDVSGVSELLIKQACFCRHVISIVGRLLLKSYGLDIYLLAECGNSREAAETFTAYFQDLVLTLPDGVEVRCSSNVFHDGENNQWSLVNPTGVIAGGNTNFELCTPKRTTEIGFSRFFVV